MAKGRPGNAGKIGAGGGMVFFALACGNAGGQDAYPAKPVRMIVSFAAGGPTDTVARLMAAKMSELLGQTFVAENRGMQIHKFRMVGQ